jgi:hypothetical protein
VSQRAFLAAFDAQAHAAFAAAGLADGGQYTAPGGGAAVPVRVMVDRTAQQLGDFGTVNAPMVTVAYLLADLAPGVPDVRGRVVVDGDTFLNVREIDNDGSLSRWEVRRA